MIRCLLPSHWSTARLCGYALTPPHDLWSVRDQILIPSHWGPTRLCRCTLTPPCWLMIRPWLYPYFRHIGSRPTCVEANITVASTNKPPGHRASSPSRCSMIRPWWSFNRCRVTKWFGGDILLTPAASDEYRQWWQNNQWPVHPTVIEFLLVFTMYLLIQLGLNSLLNTHHIDIIITHHSSCPQRRVLVIITMLDTNITIVSTDELIQAVHR